MFAFTLKNKAGETESWHIDLKDKGEAGKGLGDKPTGEAHFFGSYVNGCVESCTRLHVFSGIITPISLMLRGISANTSTQQLPCLFLTMTLASWSVERQMHNGCSWLES